MRTSLRTEATADLLVEPPARVPSLTGSSFVPGGEFSVGAEEELLLVDAEDRLRPASTRPLVERLRAE